MLGPVFRAFEPGRDRLVAVKIFRLDVTPGQSAAFLRELEQLIARDIGHPAIAAPIAAGLEGHAPYLAMEYAVGDSLDVASRPMPLSEVVPIIEGVAAAIDASADKGVHHYLLHPRDVVMSAAGPRVTGFGIAEALSRIGLSALERRPYLAPGGPADIYSLGAIAYELISGRKMTTGGWDELSAEDGPELREAFATALSDDPRARPARAREFAAKLRNAAGLQADPKFDTDAIDRFADLGATSDLRIDIAEARGQPLELQTDPGVPPFPASWSAQPPKLFQAEPPEANGRRGLTLAAILFGVLVLGGVAAGYALKWRRAQSPASSTTQTKPPVASTTVDLPYPPATETAPVPAAPTSAAPPASTLPAPTPSRPASGAPSASSEIRAARAATARGRLLIRSTPADAIVSVNGQPRGKTPLTLRDLALGSYTIRVARDGFAAADRHVRLTTERPSASLVIPLQQTAPSKIATGPVPSSESKATMTVASRPTGAHVFVNNRLVGSTPLAIPDLPAGPAAVRIEMDGYQAWATTVQVNAGESARVTASLDRK